MTRFFFDLTTRGQSLYDYKGDEFLSCEGARQHAEAIALDLMHRLNGEWAGWSVEVRNATNQKLLSLPVAVGTNCSLDSGVLDDPLIDVLPKVDELEYPEDRDQTVLGELRTMPTN